MSPTSARAFPLTVPHLHSLFILPLKKKSLPDIIYLYFFNVYMLLLHIFGTRAMPGT